MTINNLCNSCTNIGCVFQSGIVRTKCAFYMSPHIEPDKLQDFARWVAEEVIDEELWTYNYLSFAEIACRKLVRLGIMQESDGKYTYEVLEDGKID